MSSFQSKMIFIFLTYPQLFDIKVLNFMNPKLIKKSINKYEVNLSNLVIGALLGLCIIMLPSLISLDPHKFSGRIALYSFAIAIPALCFLLLTRDVYRLSKDIKPPFMCFVTGFIGIVAAIAGLISVFWYIYPPSTAVLIISGAFCFNAYDGYERKVKRTLLQKIQPRKQKQSFLEKIPGRKRFMLALRKFQSKNAQ